MTPGDGGELQNFSCTDEPVRRKQAPYGYWHPHPWEYSVQRWIRGQLCRPVRPPRYLIVGLDGEGIAAVAAYAEEDGPGEVFLQLMAVHLRLRRRGGGYADEMVEEVLDRLTTRALETGTPQVEVTAHVDQENHPSQSLCRRSGFRHVDMLDDTYQIWSQRLLI